MWLLRGGEVLAAVDEAATFKDRLKGLLGRDGIGGALLIRPARSVHTIGMGFPIDVAFCDNDLVVLDTCTVKPNRVCRPRVRACAVIEAEAGAFERWRLAVGDQLELKG